MTYPPFTRIAVAVTEARTPRWSGFYTLMQPILWLTRKAVSGGKKTTRSLHDYDDTPYTEGAAKGPGAGSL